MRLKPVTVNSTAGTSVSPPISSRIWTALRGVQVHRRTVHSRRRSSSARAVPGEGILIGSCRRRGRAPAGLLGSACLRRGRSLDDVEQPGLARLLLGVAVDRHDAVLGAAHQQVVAAGAHQVHASGPSPACSVADARQARRRRVRVSRPDLTCLRIQVSPQITAITINEAHDRAHDARAARGCSCARRRGGARGSAACFRRGRVLARWREGLRQGRRGASSRHGKREDGGP